MLSGIFVTLARIPPLRYSSILANIVSNECAIGINANICMRNIPLDVLTQIIIINGKMHLLAGIRLNLRGANLNALGESTLVAPNTTNS